VILQVGLSLLVLVSAGLCVRSLAKLQQLDAGFEPSSAVLMSFDLELNNYTSPQAVEFFGRLLERVRAFPGIEAASLASTTPLSGWSPGMSINRIEGYQPRPNDVPWADLDFISSDYFRALGSPIIRGREFTPADTAVSPRVAVVNEAFVKLYCAGRDPLGLRLYVFNGDEQRPGGVPVEVVGVVHDTRNRRLEDNPRQAMFFPVTQNPTRALTLVARTGVEPGATIKLLRGLVKSLDATVPVFQVRTLAEQKNGSLALQRLAAHLLGGFGLLALALAALGIYGVLAYSVSRRTREIGVRMALGAQIGDVLRLVILQGLGLVGLGLALGLAGAFAVTRLLSSFLFEVKPLDAPTFLVVVMVLILVALGACWLPARRAAKVHPMEALRCE
jgi:putative ABC transport system permease protein